MKKLVLTAIASLVLSGLIFAQDAWNPLGYESHWSEFSNGPYDFQGGIVAAVAIDGQIITLTDSNWSSLEIASFVGDDECRGNQYYLWPGYVEDYGDPYPILNGNPIYYYDTTNYGSKGTNEEVYFKMYDHLNGIEYTDCSVSLLGEPFTVFSDDDNFQGWWNPQNPVILNFISPVQELQLSEGWNWVSFYVEGSSPVALLDMLKAGLGDNATEIQSFDMITEYDDGEWWGDLDEIGINNDQTYWINVITPCTVQIHGIRSNPNNYSIEINYGWNWIGFPSAVALDINEALAGFEAEEEDVIQSFNAQSEFDGEEWYSGGALDTLEPGQGYWYFSNSEETKYLTFQTWSQGSQSCPRCRKNQNCQYKDEEHF